MRRHSPPHSSPHLSAQRAQSRAVLCVPRPPAPWESWFLPTARAWLCARALAVLFVLVSCARGYSDCPLGSTVRSVEPCECRYNTWYSDCPLGSTDHSTLCGALSLVSADIHIQYRHPYPMPYTLQYRLTPNRIRMHIGYRGVPLL